MDEKSLEAAAAVARSEGEPLLAALERSRRRAAGVAALLAIGVVGLVVSWSGSALLGPGAPERLLPTLAVLLAAAWCGYRVAEMRFLRRIERLLEGRPDP